MSCQICNPSRADLADEKTEMAVISCMLQAPETQVDAALRILKPDDFNFESIGLLFDIICNRHAKGEPIDVISITSYIFDKNMTERVPVTLISDCLTASPNPSFTIHYADEVLAFSKRRQMVRIASDLAHAAITGGNDEWRSMAVETMRKADTALMGRDGDEIVHITEVGDEYIHAMERGVCQTIDVPVATGITKLDEALDGGIRREYILIGGLQGHGKSLLAMQMGGKLAADGRRGLIIGYDMTPLQVFMRDLARETQVPLNQVMGRVNWEGAFTIQNVTRGIARLMSDWDVWFTRSPYMTFETAAAHARTLHRKKPLDFIVLDFLQKVPITKKNKERTDEALVSLSRRVWALQRELGCTLIAPVQLNDEGMIREARGILDDPEVFLRIEMEQRENQDGEMESGDDGWIRILKQRFGVKDRKIPVFRNGQYQRFEDRSPTRTENPRPKYRKPNY